MVEDDIPDKVRMFSMVPRENQAEMYRLYLQMIGGNEKGEVVIPFAEHVARYNMFCFLRNAIWRLSHSHAGVFERIRELNAQILNLQLLSPEELRFLVRGLFCDIDPEND